MKRKKIILKVISASQARNKLAEIIRRVDEHNEIYLVEQAGLPVAAIVSMSDLERLYPHQIKALFTAD